MVKLLTLTLLAVFYSLSCYGYGRWAQRLLRLPLPRPLIVALGLPVLIVLGGILNLSGIAYPLVLDLVACLGCVAALGELSETIKKHFRFSLKHRTLTGWHLTHILPSALLICVVFLSLSYALSAPAAFNLHDDFEKYLSHPVRMLETGTLRGSPFNALGSETLGGQAFLHGFALAHWPIAYVNTVDAVFALTLCLIVLLGMALHFKNRPWTIPFVVAIPLAVNPQYVNISSLYTAALLTILLFLGTWTTAPDGIRTECREWRYALFIGMIYASFVALKPIYVTLAAVHFVAVMGASYSTSRSFKRILAAGLRIGAASLLWISPWLLLYAGNGSRLRLRETIPFMPPNQAIDGGLVDLFSVEPLFYGFGTSPAYYTTLVAVSLLVCGVLSLHALKNPASRSVRMRVAIALSCVLPATYLLNLVLIAPRLLGPTHGLRYVCPILIGGLPSLLVLLPDQLAASPVRSPPPGLPRRVWPSALCLGLAAAILIMSLPSLVRRTGQAVTAGSVLSFSELAVHPLYLAYNHFVLSPDAEKEIRDAQDRVPPGEKLVAWTPLALHLDYGRNEILDVDPAGLANPWVSYPFAGTPAEGIESFREAGVRYILWEYRSFGVRTREQLVESARNPFPRARTIGTKSNLFAKGLADIARQSQILYDNGSILVMKLVEHDQPP